MDELPKQLSLSSLIQAELVDQWFNQQPLKEEQELQDESYQNHQRPNPQFQVTISRYSGANDLALFDHDREDLDINTQRFAQSTFLYQEVHGNNIYLTFVPEEQAKFGCLPNQNAELLMHLKLFQCTIQKTKKYYCIYPQSIDNEEEKQSNGKRLDKKIFKNIRNQKYGKQIGHRIENNDQIRFGLEHFKIYDIQLKFIAGRKKESYCKDNQSHQIEQNPESIYQQDQIKAGSCKFCLTSDNYIQNPLLSPCKCKGSCQFLHLDCLRTWLNSNLIKQSNDKVDSYNWTKFECQICKQVYPLKLRYKDRIYQLAVFQIPKIPYFVLQRLRQGSRKKIMLVKASLDATYIGRSPQNDIIIDTNSVSRGHACIEYKHGQFFLRDLRSKFGTLVKVKKDLRINGKMKLQVGDSLLRFDLVYKKGEKQCVWRYD